MKKRIVVKFEGNDYTADWEDDGTTLKVESEFGSQTTGSSGSFPTKIPGDDRPPPLARSIFIEILRAAKGRGLL